ncbi:MAG: RNA replicase [Clostridium perfringens]|uniref:RNA replicase n=1 Tax=Clostridium perfringens TaxID=1502 RepID=UPI001A32AE1D|nr:RNA replicase [Clostridium perfringens]EHR9039703.1 RNA replicase [Clostridium perfringens]MDU3334566.1 RNA replicase [Clostridium perfringens]MDU6691235.1 RNA replicase [Clostridium perfringens]HAT4290411.1 RNA replicase [Clostridium perfringens]HBI6905053.1 RNA replicase [Clostridium perfringens]
METNRAGQFRKKKIYFTQVSNVALRDSSLSLKAKGLYALIQSYLTIEDFTLYKNTLKKHLKEGEKAFESTWKELKDAAYLIQYRLQDPKTKQFYYEYELLDEPNIELANKIHNSQNRKKHEEKSHTPKKVGMGEKDEKSKKAIPTKREGMDNGYSGKVGVHNNTDLNNTNLNNINISSSSEDEEEVQKILDICQIQEFKLSRKDIKNLLLVYSFDKIAKGIITAGSTDSKIKNYKGYLVSILNDMEKVKKVDININNKDSKKSNANFTQRDQDMNELEKDLLGW